ncbi:MAG: carbon-nitrogen hydrolase family protein [Chloroflexi bacterium]|nr:carbon-nitrogen hydrolase family protein [Chloroflexota bacterium]
MKINLVAVQAKTELDDYSTPEFFDRKMGLLMEMAMADVDPALPTLVCFPEAVGMYLGFVPFYWNELKNESSFEQAIRRITELNRDRMIESGDLDYEAFVSQLLFADNALEAERNYMQTFSSLATKYDAYVSAGSTYLPKMEDNPHMGGRLVLDEEKIRNTSYLFSPRGVCLDRTSKVNIPEGEDRFTTGSPLSELKAVDTRIGRIGTAICWDGFHHTLIEHYDALGVEVLLQPSYYSGAGPLANLDPWSFSNLIQGRENIRFGVAAFLVGAVFEDRRAEGLSYIAKNAGRVGATKEDAVIAIADQAYAEEAVHAVIDLDE